MRKMSNVKGNLKLVSSYLKIWFKKFYGFIKVVWCEKIFLSILFFVKLCSVYMDFVEIKGEVKLS